MRAETLLQALKEGLIDIEIFDIFKEEYNENRFN